MPIFKILKEKGVVVNIATQITNNIKDTVKEFSKFAEVRHTDIRGRFIIIDGKEVVFMLLDDKLVHPSYDSAIWANSKFFADSFEKVFSAKWDDMGLVENL